MCLGDDPWPDGRPWLEGHRTVLSVQQTDAQAYTGEGLQKPEAIWLQVPTTIHSGQSYIGRKREKRKTKENTWAHFPTAVPLNVRVSFLGL